MVVSQHSARAAQGFHPRPQHIGDVYDAVGGGMETSCGFILVNFDSILLLQYTQGHWSFPKGHVEEGDPDHHSTAVRELTEETVITNVTISEGWSQRTQYTFRRKGKQIPKQVFWYLAETDQLEVSLSHEHTNYLWLEFEEAEQQVVVPENG